MGSSAEVADQFLQKLCIAGDVSIRKMFGEYGVYLDGKIFASICDDQLFLKITEAPKHLLGEVELGPPYPGAKPQIKFDLDRYSESDLAEIILLTVAELPLPKKKKKKSTS